MARKSCVALLVAVALAESAHGASTATSHKPPDTTSDASLDKAYRPHTTPLRQPLRASYITAAKAATASKKWSELENGARHVVAGAVSGAIGVTMLAPLETLRLNLLAGASVADAVNTLRSAPFRGNSAEVMSAAPRVGITMASFAAYKHLLKGALHRSDEQPLPDWVVFFSGALAGATATLLTHPLDVARTRMAVECTSLTECLLAAESPAALYRGLRMTLSGALPFAALKLASYDLLRKRANHGRDATSASLPVWQSPAIGAAAGVTAATVCFPFELVRRRQMLGQYVGLNPALAFVTVVREEGMRSLFKGGLRVNMLKVAIGNGLGFFLYELAKDVLEVDGRVSPLRTRLR